MNDDNKEQEEKEAAEMEQMQLVREALQHDPTKRQQ
jgi:hypothetical protein